MRQERATRGTSRERYGMWSTGMEWSGRPSSSRERGSLCGATTIGGGESHSHCSWLGTPVRGRAQFDLSSTAAAGVPTHPGTSVMHLFNPASAPRGLILLAPGGGQDHTSPGIVARATRLTDEGYAVAVVRSLDEVPAVLAEHPGPVGFWGISQGARVGLPLLAAEPRITAAVLGLADGPVPSAPLVTASVLFYVQSDDDLVQPDACRALFDALGSTDKTLIENPGGHLDLPRTSIEESVVWLDQRLAEQ